MKWIAVRDRLPKKFDRYAILSSTGYKTMLTFKPEEKKWFHENADDYWNRFVTHWMPLPPPPPDTKQ